MDISFLWFAFRRSKIFRYPFIFFRVSPYDDILSRFRFTAKEEKTGGIGRCTPLNVSLHLKSASLPFVCPDGSKVDAKLMETKKRRRHYSLKMQSNGEQYVIKIDAPSAGDWYAIAFRSWTDPEDGKIKQQGENATHYILFNKYIKNRG